jgi:hypothetical protein
VERSTVGVFAQPGGLTHRQPERQCALLNRRGDQTLTAAGGAIGLAKHQRNLMPRLDHGIKHRYREFRRTGEDQPQRSLSD